MGFGGRGTAVNGEDGILPGEAGGGQLSVASPGRTEDDWVGFHSTTTETECAK